MSDVEKFACKEIGRGALPLDVRGAQEIKRSGSLEGAVFAPLTTIHQCAEKLDKTQRYVIFCADGVRSHTAVHVLRKKGFDVIYGGAFDEIKTELEKE